MLLVPGSTWVLTHFGRLASYRPRNGYGDNSPAPPSAAAAHAAAEQHNPEALELSPLDQNSSFGGTSSALHFPNPRFDSSLTLVDSASESPVHHYDSPKPSNLKPPADPAPRAQSDLYNFFTDYIESYQGDDDFEKSELSAIAEKEHEAAMASYSNNYGPPTASPLNPARDQQQYPRQQQQPSEYNQQGQYPYDDPRNNQQAHFPPYRQNTSPDRQPGSRQNISPDRHPDYRQQSPSRQYNDQYQRHQDYSVASGNQYGQPVGPGGYGARGFNDPQANGRMRDVSAERGGDHGGQYAAAYNQQPQSSSHDSYGSEDRLATSAAPPAMSYGAQGPPAGGPFGGGYGQGYDRSASPSRLQPPNGPYRNPYDNHSISRNNLNGMDYVDPNAVIDDGDDGLEYYNPKRRSMISLNRRSMGSNPALAVAATAAIAGGAAASDPSRNGPGGQTLQDIAPEKSTAPFKPYDPDDETKSRKWKKILFIFIAILILCAIAGGVVGGLIANHKLGNSSSSSSSASNSGPVPGVDGPDMDINSPSVKKLLNNPNLHKVFMGMAYTPMNTQYPGCMSLAPIQNNVTLDLAVLSQVTNTIRLYGTDCNQTELVLHAIDRLQPLDMKVWIGVWLNNNETTNTRQISQLWSILDSYGTKYVKGVIVGNEVLYRQDLTLAQLSTYISGVRANLTSRGFNIPIASADLGDNWTSSLAEVVDVVMANVHPFFGGVPAAQAAGWTYTFWTGHDVILTQGTNKGNVISEVGWPSQGGTDCAPLNPPCPDMTAGAVSGVPEMVTFLGDWVCQTMKNGTEYFW